MPASSHFALLAAVLVVLAHVVAAQAADAPPVFASAADTDPVKLGWMAGYPPPPDKQVRYDDGSHYRFPQWRWSFSHWREVMPSAEVSRGTGPVAPLARAERDDLDAVTFMPLGGSTPLTWADSLAANYTDGIVVLHRGRIVYERYFGALTAERPHIAFSVTKSVIGTLAAMLVAEGKLEAAAPVSRYLPELAASGFGDATVDQVLDMTTALDFSENYVGGSDSFLSFARAAGVFQRPAGYAGPSSIMQFLPTIARKGNHGEAFTYRSPNTEVLGWLIARVTGKRPEVVLQERIWSRLGAESDAFIALDPSGAAVASGGFNCRLRDLARFGEMVRLQGRYNGQQIVPAAVIADIRQGGSPRGIRTRGLQDLAGLELPQAVVDLARRPRRLHGSRHPRAGDLHRSEGRNGHRTVRVTSAGGQHELRSHVAPGVPGDRRSAAAQATLSAALPRYSAALSASHWESAG